MARPPATLVPFTISALLLLAALPCCIAQSQPSPAPYTGRIVRPVVKVFGANPVRTGVSTSDYWDDGADCSDHVPFDMDLNFHVAAGGDVVRLDKAGTYTIKYYCSNDRGMSAVPKTRKVIVSNSYKPQCDEITVKGVGFHGGGAWAGTYALTKDINNGKPVYKQHAAKPHYLYSFISDKKEDHVHMWLINAYNPLDKFLDVIKSPTGLKVQSSASKPEGIHHPWKLWTGHSWADGRISVTCTKGNAVNRAQTDFIIDASVEVAGYTSKTFDVAAREKFCEATSIALDVASEDVHVLGVTNDARVFRRRLEEDMKSAHASNHRGAVKVHFEVRTPEADVAAAVGKDLHKDAFDETLYSRMGEQGMKVSRVLLDENSVTVHSPSDTARWLKLGSISVVLVGMVAFAYRSGVQQGASNAAVVDEASVEETANLRV